MSCKSKLDQDQWQQVRDAVIAGISYEQVAGEYGVSSGTIRERARHEQWPAPRRIKKMALAHKEKMNLTQSDKGRKSSEIVALSLAERGEQHALNVFAVTSKVLRRSLDKLPDPKDWKTAQIVDLMARRAAGLDRPETANVSVNLAMFASSPAKSWRRVEETG